MGFIVRKTAHRAWPVTVKQAVGLADGSVVESTSSFVAHFSAFSEAELEAAKAAAEAAFPLPEGSAADAIPPLPLTLQRAATLYAGLLVGWGPEVTDEAGTPLAFSVDALRALVTGPDGYAVMQGIGQALGELRFGVAPAKNSPTSPVPGANSGPENQAPVTAISPS